MTLCVCTSCIHYESVSLTAHPSDAAPCLPVSEIAKIRGSLFQISGNAKPEALPEPQGTVVTLTEKVYVPVREHPDVSTLLVSYTFSWKGLMLHVLTNTLQ